MGRNLRIAAAGFHHITTRGNNGRALFHDRLDREAFLAMLGSVVERLLWKCHSFCLLTNHVHLLVETPDETLPIGMHRLNLGYAQSFNRRHECTGHVFEAPYYSGPVTRDSHALMTIRYIARNPVEAGVCPAPEDWPWSSYGAALGLRPGPKWLTSTWALSLFDDDVQVARQRLRHFVDGTRSG